MSNRKLVESIKKLIKIEVKRQVQEQVKATINEMLANKFLDTINENKKGFNLNSIRENVSSPSRRNQFNFPPMDRGQPQFDKAKAAVAATSGLPKEIFEDISEEEIMAADASPDYDYEDVSDEAIQALMAGKYGK